MKKIITFLILLSFVFFTAGIVSALPKNPNVESGQAQFSNPDAFTLEVRADNNAVINFESFGIGANELVNFIQPSATSNVLCRSGGGTSEILGKLFANGNFYLVNPSGVHVAPSAVLQANNLVLSTLDVNTNNFIKGNYVFEHGEQNGYAQILNEGRLDANNIALLGSSVNNAGDKAILAAHLGSVNLASGNKVTVSFDQKGLIQVVVNKKTDGQVKDKNGEIVKDGVANSGNIEGETVYINVQTAKNIFQNAVNIKGVVKATGLAEVNGVIRLISNEDIQVSGALQTKGDTTLAADNDIIVKGNIVTDSGNLNLLADNDLDGRGSFKQEQGTSISTINYGDITIQASGNDNALGNINSAGSLILKQGGQAVTFVQLYGSYIFTKGSLRLNPGVTLNANNALYNVGKDWINEGVFNAGTSRVELISAQTAQVLGKNTFYDFSVTVPQKLVKFDSENTQAILGTLTFIGGYGKLLTLTSIDPVKQWSINPLGQTDIQYALITNSINIRGPPLKATHSDTLGNLTNWDVDPFWTGQGVSNNWSDPDNWDTGTVPISTSAVTFDGITGLNPNKDSIIDVLFGGAIANFSLNGYTGTITLGRDLIVTGDITIGSGTINAGANTITVGGNWSNSGADFQYDASTVVFNDPSKTSLISGDNAFYNFTCLTPGKTIVFEANTLTTIQNTLTIEGSSDNYVTLKSSIEDIGNMFGIYINAISNNQGDPYAQYISVRYSHAYGPLIPIPCHDEDIRGELNYNWDANYTAVAAGGNWSANATWGGLGHPIAGDNATINATLLAANTVTVNVASACATLNLTGMVGTLAFGTQTLTVSGLATLQGKMTATTGTLSVAGGVTLVGTPTGSFPALSIAGASTLTSGGFTWPGALKLNIAGNVTLSGNWINTGLVTFSLATVLNKTAAETLTCNGGITLASSTGNTGSATLKVGAASTLTSGGFTCYNPLNLGVAGNVTLSGNWINTTGLVTFSAATNLNKTAAETFTCNGGLTMTSSSGTTGTATIRLGGGTWSGAGTLYNSLTFAGDSTVSGTVNYRTGTITYTAGTVTTAGSTLNIPAACTLTTNGMSWNNITPTAGITLTLGSNLTATGILTLPGSLTMAGAFTLSTANMSVTAASTFTIVAAVTVTDTLSLSGNLTMVGNFNFNPTNITTVAGGTRTLTLVRNMAGYTNLTLGVSLTLVGNFTCNPANLTFTATSTLTLVQDMTVSTLLTVNTGVTATLAVANILLGGGLTINGTGIITGRTITMNGTGIWQHSGAGTVRSNLIFNTAGTITVSGNVYYQTGTITYTAGTVTTAGSTLNIPAACTLTTNGMSWNNITPTAGITLTLGSNLTATGILTLPGSLTMAGAFTLSTANMSVTAASTFTIVAAVTVTDTLSLSGNLTMVGNFNFNPTNITTVAGGTRTLTLVRNMAGYTNLTLGVSLTLVGNFTCNPANLTFTATSTLTLVQDMTVSTLLTVNTGVTATLAVANILLGGGLTINGTGIITGRTITMNGTGIWQHSGAGTVRSNLIFNTAGTITVSGNVYYQTGTITYTAGTVTTAGSTLNIPAACTLTTNGMSWNNITPTAGITLTLGSNLTATGILTLPGSLTMAGAFTLSTANMSVTAASTFTIVAAVTVTDTLSLSGNLTMVGNFNFNPTNITTVAGGTRTLTLVRNMAGYTNLTLGVSLTLVGNFTCNPTNLTFTASSTLTLAQAMTVGALLTVNDGVAATLAGSVTVGGTLDLTSGSLSIGANTLTLNGAIDSTGGGTLTGGASSNITFGGVGASTNLPAVTLNNLIINRANGIGLGGDVTVGGTLTLTSGALSIGANTLTLNGAISATSGTLTGGVSSNITFGGAGANTTLPSVILNDLTINRANGISLGGNVTVGDTLTLTSGTFTVGANILTLNGPTIAGTPTNLSTTSSSALVFGGSTAGVNIPSSVVALNDLTINNANGVTLNSSLTITDLLTLTSGIFPVAGNTLTLNGPTIAGTPTNLSTTSSSTLAFGGSSVGVNIPSSVVALNDLTINNANGVILNSSLTITDVLTLTSGALSIGANTLTLNGAISVTSGTLTGGASSNITFGGAGANTTLPSVILNDLTINRANGITLGGNVTVGDTLTLTSGTFTVGANILTLNGPTIAGTPTNLSTTSSSALVFGGSTAGVNIPSSVVALNDLTINNANGVTLNSNLTITDILTLTSGIFPVAGNTLTLNGPTIAGTPTNLSTTSSSTLAFGGSSVGVNIPSSVVALNSLIINNTAGVTLAGPATITTLTIGNVTAGSVFNDGGYVITAGGGTTLNLTSGTYNLGSATVATTWPAWATRNISAGTTVGYVSDIDQAVSTTPSYQNLAFSGAGTKITDPGTLTVGGSWAVGSNTELDNNNTIVSLTGNLTGTGSITQGTGLITGAGDWTNTGTFTPSAAGVTLNGGVKQITGNAAGITFTTLTVGGTYTNNNTAGLTVSTALSGGGTLTQGNSAILNISGTSGITGLTANTAGNIVNYNGGGSQTAKDVTYLTLRINNTAGVTLAGPATITTLTIGNVTAGSVFNDGGYVITAGGGTTLNLTSGTYNLGSATVATTWPAWATRNISAGTTVGYVSDIDQAVSTTPSYQNLAFSGAGTKITDPGTLTVGGSWAVGSNTELDNNNTIVSLTGNLTGTGSITQGTGLITGAGDWTNTGTFTPSAAGVTLNGGVKQITGNAAGITFTTLTVGGTYTNNNTAGLTVSTALSGGGTLTQGNSAILNISGTSGITGLTANTAGNIVNYNGGVQTVKTVVYNNLILSGSGAKTCSVATVNGDFTLSGSATCAPGAALAITGGLTINSSGAAPTFTMAGYIFSVGGTTTITQGTLRISSATGSKTFADISISGTLQFAATETATVSGDITINDGGTINYTAAGIINHSGSLVINGTGTITGTGGLWTFQKAGGTGTISGTSSGATPTITSATFTQAYAYSLTTLSIGTCTVNGTTLTNNGTLTVTAALSGTGGLTQGDGDTLNIGGTSGISALTAYTLGQTNTVNYTGAAQTVKAVAYYDLNLSGSGAKTCSVATVNGDFTLSGSATCAPGAALAITGGLTINSSGAAPTFTMAGYIFSVGGTTTITQGTLRISSATGSKTFADISISGTLQFAATETATVSGDITINDGGTINYTAAGIINHSGSLVINGTGTITGTGGLWTFQKAGGTGTISGTSSGATPTITSATFTQAYAYSLTTLSIGTCTVNGTTLTNNGTLTVTAALSGTGGLTQGDGDTLNIGGTSGISALTAYTLGQTNTVNYNGGVQTVKPTTYANLTLSNTNLKTTASVTVNGVLSMEGTATASAAPTYGAEATLQYKGSAQQTTGPEFPTIFDGTGGVIIDNASGVILGGSQAITNALTLISGAFSIGVNTLTLNGPTVAGTPTNLSTTSSSTLIFGGSSVGVNISSSVLVLNGLTINNANGVTLNSNLTISGTLTLTSGTFPVSGNTLTLNGPAIAGSPANLSTTSSSSLVFGGSSAGVNIPSSVTALNGLTIDNANGVILNSSPTISGTLTLTNGAFSIGANTLTLNGAISTTIGSLTGGSSSNITLGGAGASTDLPAVTLNNLTINRANGIGLGGDVTVGGTLTLTNGDFSIGANTLTLNGPTVAGTPANLSASSSSSLVFGGSSAGVNIPSIVTALNNLAVNNANGVTLNSNPTISGALTISGGTFSANAHTVTVAGLTTVSGTGIYLASTNTQTLNGGLALSGTGVFTGAGGTVDVTDVTVGSGATLTAPSGSFLVSGNWSVNSGATFTPGLNTVTFDRGATTQTLDSGTKSFYDVIHSGAGTLQLSNNALTVAHNFTNSNGSATFDLNGKGLTVSGTLSNSGNIQRQGHENVNLNNDVAKGTWTYVGSDILSDTIIIKEFGPTDYFNLKINDVNTNKATYVLQSPIKTQGVLQVISGTLSLAGNSLTVTGTLTNSDTIRLQGNESVTLSSGNDYTAGMWEYVGHNTVEDITIKHFGSTDYYNLKINDTTNKANFILGNDLNVAGTLTLASSTMSQGSYAITAAAYYQSGGEFVGDSASITINGAATITGDGIMLSPSGYPLTVTSMVINGDGVVRLNTNGRLVLTGSGTPLSGTGELDLDYRTPNSVEYTGQGTTDIATAGPVSSYYNLLILPNGLAQESVQTLTSGGDKYLRSAVIDEENGFAYFGEDTSPDPGRIIKVRLSDLTRVGFLTLNQGEESLLSGVIDKANGFAYFGTYGSPGKVIKVQLSDFSRNAALTLNNGEDNLMSAVIDTSGVTHYAYFGTATEPGIVVKVNLSSFTREAGLLLAGGQDDLLSAVIDTTGLNHYAYFGAYTNPGKIIRIDLSNFGGAYDVLTLNGGNGEKSISCAGIDTMHGYAYFGTDTAPAKVIKIQLSDFSYVATRTLDSGLGEDSLYSALVDPANNYAYFSTYTETDPCHIVRIDLADFSGTYTVLPLNTGDVLISCAAVIDTTGSTHYAYYGTGTSPGEVIKIKLPDSIDTSFSRNNAKILDADESGLTSAVIDTRPGEGYIYYGTDTSPGMIVKVRISDLFHAGVMTLAPGLSNLSSAVIDTGAGYAYFGTFTSPGSVVRIDLSNFGSYDVLPLVSGENRLLSASIDTSGPIHYAYFGTSTAPGNIIKVNLSTFASYTKITLDPGQNYLSSSVIDTRPEHEYIYFGTNTAPGKVIRVPLTNFQKSAVEVVTLPSNQGEDSLYSAVIDPTSNFAYFGTFTYPGRVVRVNLSSFILDSTSAITMNSGEDGLTSAVIDTTNGFAFFGTATEHGKVIKVRLQDFQRLSSITMFGSGQDFFSTAVIDMTNTAAYFGTNTAPGRIVKAVFGTPVFRLSSGILNVVNLTIGGGLVNASIFNPTINVSGNFLIQSGGSFIASGSGLLTVNGDWINRGSFDANSGVVVLGGTNQKIQGSTDFFTLTKTVSQAAALEFEAGSTQVIHGTFTLSGQSGKLLSLRSSASPTKWNLNVLGTYFLEYLDVQDSYSSGSIIATNSQGQHNTNWSFP